MHFTLFFLLILVCRDRATVNRWGSNQRSPWWKRRTLGQICLCCRVSEFWAALKPFWNIWTPYDYFFPELCSCSFTMIETFLNMCYCGHLIGHVSFWNPVSSDDNHFLRPSVITQKHFFWHNVFVCSSGVCFSHWSSNTFHQRSRGEKKERGTRGNVSCVTL